MRFRLIRRGTAAHSAVPEKPAPAAPGTPAPPKASDLDNPYGRYYGPQAGRSAQMNHKSLSSCRVRGFSFIILFALFPPRLKNYPL